jgi:hypothetical protein
MRAWILMLGGLAVWAAHFFVLYAIASVLPGQLQARWWALAATLPALIAAVLILRRALASAGSDPFALGAATALLAITWLAAPALLI